ncbi:MULTISPECIES: DUF3791 domain-containing protein [Clostridium]|uniref:DUF3791 domain-containing protein n=1 Tax=Candidatus Clostridium helianthi TaxID=3381660 RepID=A0ABW8SCB6_9CLOT
MYKFINFILENYEIWHTLSSNDEVEYMIMTARNNFWELT